MRVPPELQETQRRVYGLCDPEALRGSPFQHVGIGATAGGRPVVKLGLRADGANLARRVHERFGPDVEITLGYRLYPSGATAGRPQCPLPPSPDEAAAGVEARLTLRGDGRVTSGADVHGTLLVHNRRTTDVVLMTNQRGTVVDRDTGAAVGVSTMPHRLIGGTQAVPAGRAAEVEVVFGTTDCRPAGPPGLHPGRYTAVVALPVASDPWSFGAQGGHREYAIGDALVVVE